MTEPVERAALSPAVDGELLEGTEKARSVRSMFDRIAPRYDMVNRVITFGLDRRWRKASVRSLGLAPGSVVLDLACGTGDLCLELESALMHPIGVDFSAGMLTATRTKAQLINGDILTLPLRDASADGVTCSFAMRNLTDLGAFFAELARVTRKDGTIAMLDASEPPNRVLRMGHGIYFRRIVPVIGGLLSDRSAYSYLPKSLAYLPTPETMIAMLTAAGFSAASHRQLFGGAAQLLTATR